MLPVSLEKIKKSLPNPPPEEKVDLGRCLCQERAEESLSTAESFVGTDDDELHLSKEQRASLRQELSNLVCA